MKKFFILISLCICVGNLYCHEYILKRDFQKQVWEIYIDNNENQKLWYTIKDEFKDVNSLFKLVDGNLFFIGKNNTIMKLDIVNRQLTDTKIPFNLDFVVSEDSSFLCTLTKIDVINPYSDIEDVFGISIKKQQYFPVIYELKTGEILKKCYISEIENYKGEVVLLYDKNINSFLICYINDFPYSETCVTISIPDFSVKLYSEK